MSDLRSVVWRKARVSVHRTAGCNGIASRRVWRASTSVTIRERSSKRVSGEGGARTEWLRLKQL